MADQPNLDPDAPRKHANISVGLNEYEWGVLEKLAKHTGRSKLNTIRWAILKAAEAEAPPTSRSR